MYIYLLLFISSTAAAVDNRRLWGILGNIMDITHETYVPEDARLDIKQLAEKYQYPLEEHKVVTQDGYILNMHRIPSRQDGGYRPVVFLMHGIVESSISWLLLGPQKALAFVLADRGFDVWMGNVRGNEYAHTHTTLNSSMSEYWQFSWEEIAVYDLPAMIDYILQATKQQSLYYVGHSQGTTVGYVMCSMRPEYNNKIKMMFSLAPVAWMGHIKSPIVRFFSPAHDTLGFIFSDINTFTTQMDSFKKISSFICTVTPASCDNIVYALSGHETKVDKTFLSVILGHWPTASSTLQFVHYGQLVESERFSRFDYGEERNMIKYGQSSAPDYDLSKIVVPVVLYYSPKDFLSNPQDVLTLKDHLPNVNGLVLLKDFTHIDYIYATDAVDLVYNNVIKRIDNYEKQHIPR